MRKRKRVTRNRADGVQIFRWKCIEYYGSLKKVNPPNAVRRPMKRLLWLTAIGVGAVALLFCLPKKRIDASLHDLSWTVTDDVLTFDFRVSNLTNENVMVRVDLIADLRRPSDTEPEVSTVGQRRVEILLSGQQEKSEHGQIPVHGLKAGRLTLSPFMTVTRVAQNAETNSAAKR